MEKTIYLAGFGIRLWTRERAREIRERLVADLDQLEEGDVMVVDLKGVEVFDYSFANELFGKTILGMPVDYPGRFLVVENLTKYTKENLEKALESLGLTVIERTAQSLHLIGKVHPTDQETFAALLKLREPATSSTLKDKLGIGLTAMNERLSKLAQLGVIRRESTVSEAGREQYKYSVPS